MCEKTSGGAGDRPLFILNANPPFTLRAIDHCVTMLRSALTLFSYSE